MILSNLFENFAAACTNPSFLGFPTWYEYLKLNTDCTPMLTSVADIWLIVAAVLEILLRIAALVALIMVIYGGIEFITSQGEPDKSNKARSTVINALIGLVIAVVAATVVTFIAGSFNS
jgi:hypothetical protein